MNDKQLTAQNPDNKYLRPILFYVENTTNLEVEGIHMKDSPCWTNFVVGCKSDSRQPLFAFHRPWDSG